MRGTLLDIGAGIGALTFELLNTGFGHATAVDASSAYVAAGREETVRRGLTHDLNMASDEGVAMTPASETPIARRRRLVAILQSATAARLT